MANKTFEDILLQMKEMHERKAKDYAKETNPYSNFTFAGALASQFKDPTDRCFATLIGVKLARIIELQDKNPINEPVMDSFLDLSLYTTLWYAYRKDIGNLFIPELQISRDLDAGLREMNMQQGNYDPIPTQIKEFQCSSCYKTCTGQSCKLEYIDRRNMKKGIYYFCNMNHREIFIKDQIENGWEYDKTLSTLYLPR